MKSLDDSQRNDDTGKRLLELEQRVQTLRALLLTAALFLLVAFLAWLIPPLRLPFFMMGYAVVGLLAIVGFIRVLQLILARLF